MSELPSHQSSDVTAKSKIRFASAGCLEDAPAPRQKVASINDRMNDISRSSQSKISGADVLNHRLERELKKHHLTMEDLQAFCQITHHNGSGSLGYNGKAFARKLLDFITNKVQDYMTTDKSWSQHQCTDKYHLPLVAYTSTVPRAIQTVDERGSSKRSLATVATSCEQQSCLNFLDTGMCQRLTIDQIRSSAQATAQILKQVVLWKEDKFHYRYPGGESQQDMAVSLEPLVLELEREQRPVLIVSHLSTLQVLYNYCIGGNCDDDNKTEYPTLDLPYHTVVELVPSRYGWVETRYRLDEEDLSFSSGSRKSFRPIPVLRNAQFY